MCDLSFLKYWSGTRKLGVAFMVVAIASSLGAALTGVFTYYTYCVPNAPVPIVKFDCNCDDTPKPCPTVPLCEGKECENDHPFMPDADSVMQCSQPCPEPPRCSAQSCLPVNCTTSEVPPEGNSSTVSLTPLMPQVKDVPFSNETSTKPNGTFLEIAYGEDTLEYFNQYPAGSNERLLAATLVLDQVIKPHVTVMSRRNCDETGKVCRVCEDHYKWLRCVVNSELRSHKHPEKRKGNVFIKPFSKGFDPMARTNIRLFGQWAFGTRHGKVERKWYPLLWNKEKAYESLRLASEALWFVTKKGEECSICMDSPDLHIDCISYGSKFPWVKNWALFNISEHMNLNPK